MGKKSYKKTRNFIVLYHVLYVDMCEYPNKG